MAQIAAVAVDKATPQFDREYSYLVPDSLPVQVGCRVTVPFGRGNRRRLGLVLSLSESEDTARLKKIASLVDRQPLIGEEQLGLMRWLREHTFCSWFDAVRVLIPAGLGMDLEDQAHVFERFYRVGNGDRHDVKGFGLGLSYAKDMAERHGGNIHVESREHHGSTFTLIIPFRHDTRITGRR